MASVIHRGSFSSMNPAYSAIFQWIEANGYDISGPGRELTLAYEPGGDETKSITEIQFPPRHRASRSKVRPSPLGQRLTEHPRGKTQHVFLVHYPKLSLQR
jgi:GyrI-like small molecule binding domain